MQVKTLRDVVRWTDRFHQNLSQCLIHCADNQDKERASLLLNYLSDHEKTLQKTISRIEQSASINALNTWCYEYLDKYPIRKNNECDKPFDKMNTDEIIREVVTLHNQVISLYRFLLSRAECNSSRELLKQLVTIEEHEAMQMSHSANRLRDL